MKLSGMIPDGLGSMSRLVDARLNSNHLSGRLPEMICGLRSRERNPFNKLKTSPTPNKNGSYGIKGEVRMPYFMGPYAIFSAEIP